MSAAKSTEGKLLSTSMLDQDVRARLRELQRTKLLAGGVLLASLAVLVIAKLAERHNPGFGFLAAFAEAATIGGLADWYAVVVLFRRPLGLPLPRHGHRRRDRLHRRTAATSVARLGRRIS